MLEFIAQILAFLFPWPVRRVVLRFLFNADFPPGATVGRSVILNIGRLTMSEGSRIGDFNVIRNLDHLSLGARASIGTFNWISGSPTRIMNPHFRAFPNRRAELSLGEESAIVARHIIDCTDSVSIGKFSTVAGHRSQILTHEIDLRANMQSCEPVEIGDYCFVGTGVVILKGAILPSYSILAAGSILVEQYDDQWSLYAGNPARKIKSLDDGYKYFVRTVGFVT